MQLIPIYSLNSEPYFQRVPEDKLAIALNSKGWQQCPPEPEFNAATQHPPKWVDEQWMVADKTTEELAAEYRDRYPDAESYQVRAWLIRNGIDPASIPALITSLTQPGAARDEALMRWEYAVRVPSNHPLVGVIAANLGLNAETIWPSILEL
jgi:hypothetical protein